MSGVQRFRFVVNLINLSTLLGWVIATAARTRLARGPYGLLIATGYRWRIPVARAFTVGNVIITRLDHSEITERTRLLAHEARHATQYAVCIGPLMLPLYFLAAGWSLLITGDHYSRNIFERLANLADGDYVERPARRLFRSSAT